MISMLSPNEYRNVALLHGGALAGKMLWLDVAVSKGMIGDE